MTGFKKEAGEEMYYLPKNKNSKVLIDENTLKSEISNDTLIWRKGIGWKSASEIDELKSFCTDQPVKQAKPIGVVKPLEDNNDSIASNSKKKKPYLIVLSALLVLVVVFFVMFGTSEKEKVGTSSVSMETNKVLAVHESDAAITTAEAVVTEDPVDEVNQLVDSEEASELLLVDSNYRMILGNWEGVMNKKKLLVVIEEINGDSIYGYNALGSNKRPLRGVYKEGTVDLSCAVVFDLKLHEPGDDKWDGIFTIQLAGSQEQGGDHDGPYCEGVVNAEKSYGSWKSNNGKLAHEFTLVKK
jgi:hypothetical protein